MKRTKKSLSQQRDVLFKMRTDNPVELSGCQLEVKLNKHYLPFLALRTLPDTYPAGKGLPREATAA